MAYRLEFTKAADKDLEKLDPSIRRMILGWLNKNVNQCSNPRVHGKALVGNHAGEWRYRIGDYRVICIIKDEELIVLAIEIGHRREIYSN